MPHSQRLQWMLLGYCNIKYLSFHEGIKTFSDHSGFVLKTIFSNVFSHSLSADPANRYISDAKCQNLFD